ncbi:MAG: aquaporin Z [Bacteroidales bacterium]|nr:aquaporin Z [Bacteroidales bacterium]
MKKLFAECLGTFVLVLFGCGSAVLAGQGIGLAGIAAAFGLSVLVMAYAVGPISGGHFNPAVTVGLAVAGRFEWKNTITYILAQLIGAIFAAFILWLVVKGQGVAEVGQFAGNKLQNGYNLWSGLLIEVVMTAVFITVILGSTAKEAHSKFAPIAIGLTLMAIHLVSIPVTNTSVNPARSTSQAIFTNDPEVLKQLWMFWLAPILGAVLGGLKWRIMDKCKK